MAGWTRTRLALLRRRASELTAQVGNHVPTEVGGPFVTALDMDAAATQMQDLAAAARAGLPVTNAQALAVLALLDAGADAREAAAREQADAAYGAGYATGQQNGYNPLATDYDQPHADPEPDW
jgi:hypothetical protein